MEAMKNKKNKLSSSDRNFLLGMLVIILTILTAIAVSIK